MGISQKQMSYREGRCSRRMNATSFKEGGEETRTATTTLASFASAPSTAASLIVASSTGNPSTDDYIDKRKITMSPTTTNSAETSSRSVLRRFGMPLTVCALLFIIEICFPSISTMTSSSRRASTILHKDNSREEYGEEYGNGNIDGKTYAVDDIGYPTKQLPHALTNDIKSSTSSSSSSSSIMLDHLTEEQHEKLNHCKHIAINYPENVVHHTTTTSQVQDQEQHRYCSTPRAHCMDHVVDCLLGTKDDDDAGIVVGSTATVIATTSTSTPPINLLKLEYPVDAEQHFVEIHTIMKEWATNEGYDVSSWKENHPFIQHWESQYERLRSSRNTSKNQGGGGDGGCISDIFGPYIPLAIPLFNDPYYVYTDDKELTIHELRKRHDDIHNEQDITFAVDYTTEEVVAATRSVVKFANALRKVLRNDVPYITIVNELGGTRITVMDTIFDEYPNILVLNGASNYNGGFSNSYSHISIPSMKSPKEESTFMKHDLHYRNATNIIDRGHLLSLVVTKDDIISRIATGSGGGAGNSDGTVVREDPADLLLLNDRIHNQLVSLAFQFTNGAGGTQSHGNSNSENKKNDNSTSTTTTTSSIGNNDNGLLRRRSLRQDQHHQRRNLIDSTSTNSIDIEYEYYQSHNGYDDISKTSKRVLYDSIFSLTTSSRGIYERLQMGLLPIYVYNDDSDDDDGITNNGPSNKWKLELPYNHLPIYDTDNLVMKVPISELNDFILHKLSRMSNAEIRRRENLILSFRKQYLTTSNILHDIDIFMLKTTTSSSSKDDTIMSENEEESVNLRCHQSR